MPQTILITGASSGFGRAAARRFAAAGWNVVATMRQPAAETELNQLPRVLVTHLDVQDPASITAAVAAGRAQFGHLDVLLNNAGYALMGPFETTSRDQVQRQFDVNVFGVMEVTRAVLPHFRAQGSGLIINMSSMGGRITFPLLSVYHATKFALEGFSEALAYELQGFGIGVKLVEPGAAATNFGGRSRELAQDLDLPAYAPFQEAILAQRRAGPSPFGVTPEQVAEVIYQAATDGTDTLRYVAGTDAAALLQTREQQPDQAYVQAMRRRVLP